MPAKISLLIPTYNHAKFLPECIKSIQNQSYTDWEAIVVDDGSTDDTSEVITPFLSSKVKYFKQPNSGTAAARNKALQEASGELILPLDADDILTENALENLVEAFADDPEILIAYSDTEKFGDKSRKMVAPDYISFDELLLGNYIFNTSMFQKKDLIPDLRYDENILKGEEDWDFWLQLMAKHPGRKLHKLKEPIFRYRNVADSRSKVVKEDTEQAEKNQHYIYHKHFESYHNHHQSYLYNLRRRVMYEQRLKKIFNHPLYKIYDQFMSLWKKK